MGSSPDFSTYLYPFNDMPLQDYSGTSGFGSAPAAGCVGNFGTHTSLDPDTEWFYYQLPPIIDGCCFHESPSLIHFNPDTPNSAANYSSDSGDVAVFRGSASPSANGASTPFASNYSSPTTVISCSSGGGFADAKNSNMAMAASSPDVISSCITAAPSSPLITTSITCSNLFPQPLSPAPVDMPAGQQDVCSLVKSQNPNPKFNPKPNRAPAKRSSTGRPTQRRIRTATIRIEQASANRQISFGGAQLVEHLLYPDSNGLEQGRPGAGISDDMDGADSNTEMVSLLVATDSINLMDGYTWKKYGEKKIKNKSYTRSYFKCANAGCQITKRTQRHSNKEVMFTYIGRHNHHP